MEKTTIFLTIFIFIFLIYSYIKFKKEILKKEILKKEIKEKTVEKKEEGLEKPVIAAVIAVLMEGKKYKIRTIFLEKETNKNSTWKISGRQYNMQRRERV